MGPGQIGGEIGGPPHQVAERLEDRRIRPGAVDRRGDGTAGEESPPLGAAQQPLGERRLPDSRRAGEEQQGALAPHRIVEGLVHHVALTLTADEIDFVRGLFADVGRVLGEQRFAQRDGLVTGCHPEFLVQCPLEAFELTQSGHSLPVGGEPAHQRDVGLLVGRIDVDHFLPAPVRAQEVEVAVPQPVTRDRRPFLVRIVREEITAVEVDGGADVVFTGEPLELVHVDDIVALRPEHHLVVAQDDRLAIAHRGTGMAGGLVEAGRGLVEGGVGPECVDHLLAVHAAAVHGEELHQRCAVTTLERRLVGGHVAMADLETPEEPDPRPYFHAVNGTAPRNDLRRGPPVTPGT